MKKLVLVLVVFILAASLWAEGNTETEKITWKLGHMLATDTAWHKAAVLFSDKVKEYTKGAIEVVVYPAQQLGDERTLVEATFMGGVDVMIQGAGWSVGGVPEVSVAELPFLYKSYAHAGKAIPQVLIPYMNTKMIPKGVRLIDGAYAYTAYRGILSKDKVIATFADIKGLKIRVPQNPVYVNTFQAAGANTTVINFGELYTALQSGVVEACELTPELIVGAKLQETAKNFSLTYHILAPLFLGINEKSWQKAGKYQSAVKKAAIEAMDWMRSQTEENDARFLQAMKDSGVKVTDPGDAERQKFREAAQVGYWNSFFEKYPETKAVSEKVLALK